MDVQLYVYDLSGGLARQMSRQFLGTQIDAVYHTSLVFGGVEYFFGRGIHTARPGSTHHGRPMEVIPLGQTSLPQDVIQDYLESLKEIYTAESYSLFYHNCNNFTNDFAMFLVGRGIPSHITTLPKTVLDTPFGQMLQTQLDSAMRPITQAPVEANPVARNAHPNGTREALVQTVTTAQQLDEALEQARTSCAVIFFTSATCAPCKALYPLFDDLAAESGSRARFFKVDVSSARDIGMRYSVTATPTFVTLLHGQQYERWTGADPSQLRGTIQALLQLAFPPHPHQAMKIPYLRRLGSTKAITYSKLPPLDKLRAKMGERGKSTAVTDCVSFITNRGSGKEAQAVPVPDLPKIGSFFIECLHAMPTETLFTVYDLFRLLIIDPRVSGYFLAEPSLNTILALLNHVTKLQQSSPSALPYNLHLCAIHLAANLFTSTLIRDAMRSPNAESLASALVNLITSAILNKDRPALSVSASSLAYNLAKLENTERVAALENHRNATSVVSEGLQVELAASLVEAISASSVQSTSAADGTTALKTSDGDVALRHEVLALAHFIYLTPMDGELFDLCEALDLKGVLKNVAGDLSPKVALNGAGGAGSASKESETKQTLSLIREVDGLLVERTA